MAVVALVPHQHPAGPPGTARLEAMRPSKPTVTLDSSFDRSRRLVPDQVLPTAEARRCHQILSRRARLPHHAQAIMQSAMVRSLTHCGASHSWTRGCR